MSDLLDAANVALKLGAELSPPKGTKVSFRCGTKKGWVATVRGPSPGRTDVVLRLQSGRTAYAPPMELRIMELPEGCPELDQWHRLTVPKWRAARAMELLAEEEP